MVSWHAPPMLAPDLFARLDLASAVAKELQVPNRLLPRRWDYSALAPHADGVAEKLKPVIRRGKTLGSLADVVLADKGWRGVRPLNVMSLQDRVLYRALVDLITLSLPEHLRQRPTMRDFRLSPLQVEGVTHITKTDVTAYYQYVDHDLLADELIAQTGEEPAVDALTRLLRGMMGRSLGIPQIHQSSDVLGDTYLDPVRRQLAREGLVIFRYSDDFRIASTSLGQARRALESCATAVRERGLVLNERKTFTYRKNNYVLSLLRYRTAEQDLFANPDNAASDDDLALLDDAYSDEEVQQEATESPTTLGSSPVTEAVDDDEAIAHAEGALSNENGEDEQAVDERRARAAERAWQLWLDEDEDEHHQSSEDASVTQSLLGRALPTLGANGDDGPLNNLGQLLRYEPALTPQLAGYIVSYAATGGRANRKAARALAAVARSDLVSSWQALWLAQSAGSLTAVADDDLTAWLSEQVVTGRDALAATAAAALGRRGGGDSDVLARRLSSVGPEWRTLLLYGLGLLAPERASDTADSDFDRLLLNALPS